MDVSIVIVNWNSKDYLERCVKSVLAWTTGIEYEIIVIDNASFDGGGEMLRACYPQVRFIQSEKNIGFARANNLAFGASSGRQILFLNPDTELESPAVQTLSSSLESLREGGIVGAKLLNSDRSVQTSSIRAFPTILNQLFDSDALRNAFPRAGMWGTDALFREGDAPVEVDAVSGACLMIKRPVFEAVGTFSDEYFMYSEDIDLCFKVRQAGWKTYYVPTAVMIHHGGRSSSQHSVSIFSSVMLLESRWRFFRKTRSVLYCWSYRLAMCVSSIVRIGLSLLVWPIDRLRGRGNRAGNVVKKWAARLRWTLGGERWVRGC
jgi:GT2 family glycosyltransferase